MKMKCWTTDCQIIFRIGGLWLAVEAWLGVLSYLGIASWMYPYFSVNIDNLCQNSCISRRTAHDIHMLTQNDQNSVLNIIKEIPRMLTNNVKY